MPTNCHFLLFLGGLVGTDFRSKQVLLMIHIWILHKRLISDGKDGLLLQEALFDALWEDTSNRIRGQGVNELSVRKSHIPTENHSIF